MQSVGKSASSAMADPRSPRRSGDPKTGPTHVRGCSVHGKPNAITIGEGVAHATVDGNNGNEGVGIEDLSGKAIVKDNE